MTPAPIRDTYNADLISCVAVQSRLSEYLDGAVSGVEMRNIAHHLGSCPDCTAEFEVARSVQHTLASLGAAKPPADLGLRLRLAISHERQRSWAASLEQFRLHWANALRPLVLQLSAGLAATVLLLGGILFLIGAMGAANPVMANDEPLGAITAPHYLYSMSSVNPILTPHDETIVVDTAVNARGEVFDYHIVSGPQDPAVLKEIVSRLLVSVFQPASVFGSPVRGHVIITFSGISVRG